MYIVQQTLFCDLECLISLVKIGESNLSYFNASSEFLIWGIERFRGHYIFNNVLIFYFEIQENDFEENLFSHAKSFTFLSLKFEVF